MTFRPAACAAAAVLLAATPARADAPTSVDQVVVWGMYQLEPNKPDKLDNMVYFTKLWWLTPDTGLYAFYNTGGSTTVRAMKRWDLGADFSLTGQAGARSLLMGSAPPVMSPGYRLGPEAALILARPLGGGFSWSLMNSHGYVVPMNAGTGTIASLEAGHLMFYAGTLHWDVGAGTQLAVGVMGAWLTTPSARLFHNLGPTFSASRRW